MALHHSQEVCARPSSDLIRWVSIVSVQLVLVSAEARSLRSASCLFSGPKEYEGYMDRCAQQNKQRRRDHEARLTVNVAEAEAAMRAAAEEEAIRVHVLQK